MITISELPLRLSPVEAIKSAYEEDVVWVVKRLMSKQSVLIECDKQLYPYLFQVLRGHFDRGSFRLISGMSSQDGSESSSSLIRRILTEIRTIFPVQSGEQILVLPHLDILTTTTRSSLNDISRELIAMLYDNPLLRILAFKDPSLGLIQPIESFFTCSRKITGIRREALSKLILQQEARKFHDTHFNPYVLYPYVSGCNVLRLRQIMESVVYGVCDYDPILQGQDQNPILSEIRNLTHNSNYELPNVDLHNDIGGYEQVKKQIQEEIIDLLQTKDTLVQHLGQSQHHEDPTKKQQTILKQDIAELETLIPKGILFHGPAGTGKTFLAKAIATALNASILIVSGPELKSKWVGESEENLRNIFAQARQSAPSIIVFDEIDSFASSRGTYTGSGVEHSMVNQMLTEMDGFRKEEMVFVVATTNFLESVDSALLRPGRFELHVHIPYPNKEDRKEILDIYIQKFNLPVSESLLEYILQRTQAPVDAARDIYFSGDHLYALCRSLKRIGLRKLSQKSKENKGEISSYELTKGDVDQALDKSNGTSIPNMTEEERHVIAHHEMGHALAAYVLPNSTAIERIVVGNKENGEHRGVVGGYVSRAMRENKYVVRQNELLDDITVLLAGREAERAIFGEISGGAWDDLRKASDIATFMVQELAMTMDGGLTGRVLTNQTQAVSGNWSAKLDQEIQNILHDQQQRAQLVIQTYYKELREMTKILLEKGELEDEAIVALFDSFQITSKSFPPACLIKPFVDVSSKEEQINDQVKKDFGMSNVAPKKISVS